MSGPPSNSRKPESLDEIVSHSAATLAEQIQAAAAWAKSEMDLQIEVAGVLKGFAKQAQIKLEGHHNVTIATGRPDSVYGGVIVEYKDPNTLSPNKDAAPNKALVKQLKQRFYDKLREEHVPWKTMFGVGTDGKYFVFLRFRDDKWTDQEPLEVNRYSTERFLWALYNLGQKGKPYQPEYLHGDFGAESPLAQEGVRTLYHEILATDNPKAEVFFSQWKILFGEVCGYDVENLSDKLKKLAEFYAVTSKPHPAQLLFAVHTYYAILIKLLASEIVSFFNPWMTRQVERLQSATTPGKLRRELEELEKGGVFHTLGITNFLEGDLFSWYLPVWSDAIQSIVRKMVTKLDEYNPGTFSEDPAQSRDLLKKLYQQLFPKSVRHDLGEYYTPDWLADHVLNELGYEGDPDKRLLDPACGSGTFLVMAINRVRRWYDLNRERCAYDEGDLLRRILANVVGFDLNPLAVMAARTNYLVAIKDLVRHLDHVEIPVYLCDSIMTPAEYGDLFTTGVGEVAKVPCSAMKPPHLLVPKEIARNPRDVAKYADILEHCVKTECPPSEFLSRCQDEDLNMAATDAHLELYNELVKLDKANKNGIWARIIKNNFAPLFVGKVDYVAGNPPWVNWENLPAEYRQSTAPLWQKYNLFRHKGYRAKLGGAKDDISILMAYVAHDCYLSEGGRLGFVITQSVFKTKGGGEGFRIFQYHDNDMSWFLSPLSVQDFSDLQPFEDATNRTATFVAGKSRARFEYPVPYVLWERLPAANISLDSSLDEVMRETSRTALSARPVNPDDITSPWLTAPTEAIAGLQKAMGSSTYRAYAGCCTWLNGVFWLRLIDQTPRGDLLIENLNTVGKIKVEHVETAVESDLVYPLLRGRDVSSWRAEPSAYMILANRTDKLAAIPEPEMRRKYPKSLSYLKKFESQLRKRSGYRQYFGADAPFYSVYNVGPYTMSEWKVVWREQSSEFQAAVVGCLRGQPILADHKLMTVPCASAEEAHYLAALLGCSTCRLLVASYALSTSISTHVLEHLAIPLFDETKALHLRLSKLSVDCHAAAAQEDKERVASLEDEIDKASAKLWNMNRDELDAVRRALLENRGSDVIVLQGEHD